MIAPRCVARARVSSQRSLAPRGRTLVAKRHHRCALQLDEFDGIWCVPKTPYRSIEGALLAIRFARERKRPFLGPCGGFQHAVIEFARDELGWSDAEHSESAPGVVRPVIVSLDCGLVEVPAAVRFEIGSRIHSIYALDESVESYNCRYGVSEEFQRAVVAGPLMITGRDAAGDVRAIELAGHPFYFATLFQPERGALADRLPPLIAAFVHAAAVRRADSANPADSIAGSTARKVRSASRA